MRLAHFDDGIANPNLGVMDDSIGRLIDSNLFRGEGLLHELNHLRRAARIEERH